MKTLILSLSNFQQREQVSLGYSFIGSHQFACYSCSQRQTLLTIWGNTCSFYWNISYVTIFSFVCQKIVRDNILNVFAYVSNDTLTVMRALCFVNFYILSHNVSHNGDSFYQSLYIRGTKWVVKSYVWTFNDMLKPTLLCLLVHVSVQ